MADEKGPPPGSQRRRRPPTVINLEATEVEAGPAAAAPRTDAPAVDEALSSPPPEHPARVAAEPPSRPPPRKPPPPEPPGGPASGATPSSGPRMFAWLPEELSWAQASAGIAAAAGGALVFVLLWLVGAFSGGRDASVDMNPRLAAIEKQLQDLAARPMPTNVDAKAIEELAARFGKVESAQAAPRAPISNPVVLGRLGATEQAVKSIADNVAALSRRSDGVDAALRDSNARLDKISAALTELQTTVRAAAVGSDRAVRLAVAAGALRVAVERGAPFTTELATVKALTSNGSTLAALEPFAASGLPSDAALGRELAAIVQPMLRAAGGESLSAGASFLERLQANAERLVRIRPIDEVRGDDRSAILARIERRAARADIAGALAELDTLPPEARGPAQAWIAKAQARNKAVEVSRRIAADAVAALKATP
jgi:hypothetical protein